MKIRVQIIDNFGMVSHEGIREVDYPMMADAMGPMDFPSHGCDAMTETLCTPKRERVRVEQCRDQLSKALAAEFMALFAAKDTEMGYAKPPEGGDHA